MRQLSKRTLFAGGSLFVITIAAVLLRPAFTPAIRTDNGIASLEEVNLNGAQQWVLIRGQDQSRPILLFLHGGPGMPMMYLAQAFQRPLERDYLVVHWDRRGAGKSFSAGDSKHVRFSQEKADAIRLIEVLRQRFNQNRVILVGHSYGSYLGISLAKDRPDLVRAYIGVGQVACDGNEVRRIQDVWLAGRARATGDSKLLFAIESQQSFDHESALFQHGGELQGKKSFVSLLLIGLRAPEYSFRDVLNVKRGVTFTHEHWIDDGPGEPLFQTIPQVDVPVYFFVGRHDYTTPFECTERYFNVLKAPAKHLVWFENSAHFAFLEEPVRFHRELLRAKQ